MAVLKKQNREIENAFNMLCYLYDEIKGRKFKTFTLDGINTLDSLYAAIVSRWCTALAKQGLYKEYVVQENGELTSPNGQINIQESITRQTRSRGTLICSYDELSEDIYINHILKGTLQYLLFNSNVDEKVKVEVKKALQMFNGVGYVDINLIHWKAIKYNNNNMAYKHLIELCKTMLDEQKACKNGILTDDQRMYILFKKQIRKWFIETYNDEDNTVEIVDVPYERMEDEPEFELKTSKSQRMVAIRNDRCALLICVRLQDEKLQKDNTLGRRQAEELVRHCREYKDTYRVKVFGCVVYVNIDKKKLNLQPITVNAFNDYMIGETTVDVYDQWLFVENKLKDCYKYFIERENNRAHKVNNKKSKK